MSQELVESVIEEDTPPPISGFFVRLEHTDTRMRIHTESNALGLRDLWKELPD